MTALEFPSPHAFVGVPEDDGGPDPGLDCELKTYEVRYNSRGEQVDLQVEKRQDFHPVPRDRDHESAMVLKRIYTKEGELTDTELHIKSPHIQTALRTVIIDYPGINTLTKPIIIRDTPKCIFHYRKEIEAYGATLENPVALQHIIFLLRYMYRTLQHEMIAYYSFMESPHLAPSLDFPNLWMAFRPGDYIYTKSPCDRVLRLRFMSGDKYWPKRARSGSVYGSWTLTAEEVNYDGTNFGYVTEAFYICSYEGYRNLQELAVFPLNYHPDKDDIMKKLVARGQKFVRLHGIHYRYYGDFADKPRSRRSNNSDEDDDEDEDEDEDHQRPETIIVKSRIIIDSRKYCEQVSNPLRNCYKPLIKTKTGDHLVLSDLDYLICHHQIPGFSMVTKEWSCLYVERIKEITFNPEAFDRLVLPSDQKEAIRALVSVHNDERLRFDDVIQGKGKRMIFLLHGEPGTGKTLTAESVAEYTQQPLYVVRSGDMGTSASTVEKELSDTLALATRWNAILLIDEADVFLEQRSAHDLKRNSVVSVFLRALEYYEGILFLTTNRVGAFDKAFKSRIHLAIKYPSLSSSSRRELWRMFIQQTSRDVNLLAMDDQLLDRLANELCNGRQIKNIVQTANALSLGIGENLSVTHLETALKMMKAFDADFAEESEKEKEERNTRRALEPGSKRQRIN